MKKIVFLFFALIISICASADDKKKEHKLSNDGPYIIYNQDRSVRVITVEDSLVKDTTYQRLPKNFRVKVTDAAGRYTFDFPLHRVERPKCHHAQASKLFIMSDPHGNFDCVVSLLKGNGIIDDDLCWAYGNNQLAILGDIFDRGVDVLPIYWLFYKLEAEAEKAGGTLIFILGNHEQLVLMNDLRYTEKKYTTLAKKLGMKYPDLFAPNTELGKWICTRNSIENVGRNILVHAGLSREFYDLNLTFEQTNEIMTQGLYKRKADRKAAGELVYFMHASNGPIWYRGLVQDEVKRNPIRTDSLDLILQRYEADRIIVGHTIFDEPSPFYNQRVFSVNVENKENKEARRGRAYLFMDGRIYVANDGGVMKEIPLVR